MISKAFDMLKNRSFLNLWIAQIFEQMSDSIVWMSMIALASGTGTEGAFSTSQILVWLTVPMIIFGNISGVYIDRLDRKILMIVTNAIRALLVFILAFVIRSGLPLFFDFFLIFLISSVTQFFIPAKTSIIPNIVEENELIVANSISTSTGWIITLIGCGLGSISVAHIGIIDSLILALIMYLVSAFFITMIKKSGRPVPVTEYHEETKDVIRELKEGFKHIIHTDEVAFVVRRMAILMAIVGILLVEVIMFVNNVLTKNETIIKGILVIGYIQIAIGIGIILAPVFLGLALKKINKTDIIRLSFILSGVILVFFSLTNSLVVVLCLAPLLGLAFSSVAILVDTILQLVTPDKILGRVSASMITMRNITFVLGATFIGLIDKFIGRNIYNANYFPARFFSFEQFIFLILGIFLIIYGLITAVRAIRLK